MRVCRLFSQAANRGHHTHLNAPHSQIESQRPRPVVALGVALPSLLISARFRLPALDDGSMIFSRVADGR